MTIETLCKLTGYGKSYCYRLIRQGKLPPLDSDTETIIRAIRRHKRKVEEHRSKPDTPLWYYELVREAIRNYPREEAERIINEARRKIGIPELPAGFLTPSPPHIQRWILKTIIKQVEEVFNESLQNRKEKRKASYQCRGR